MNIMCELIGKYIIQSPHSKHFFSFLFGFFFGIKKFQYSTFKSIAMNTSTIFAKMRSEQMKIDELNFCDTLSYEWLLSHSYEWNIHIEFAFIIITIQLYRSMLLTNADALSHLSAFFVYWSLSLFCSLQISRIPLLRSICLFI